MQLRDITGDHSAPRLPLLLQGDQLMRFAIRMGQQNVPGLSSLHLHNEFATAEGQSTCLVISDCCKIFHIIVIPLMQAGDRYLMSSHQSHHTEQFEPGGYTHDSACGCLPLL